MAVTTSSSLARSRPIHTTVASRCCLRVAAMADLSRKPAEARHCGSVPIADFASGHQRHAVMAENVVEQGFQIFDAMRNACDIGMNRNSHHARIGCALEVEPVELVGTALQKLLGRKMLQRMNDD